MAEQLYTPDVADAVEDAYAGVAVTSQDPKVIVLGDHSPVVMSANLFFNPVQNEILALQAGRVSSASYLQTWTCLSGLAVGDPVYVSANDTVTLADATTATKAQVIGFVRYKPTTTTCYIEHFRYVSGLSGGTAGGKVYLTDAGGFSASAGTVEKIVGQWITATEALLNASQMTALGGGVSGGTTSFVPKWTSASAQSISAYGDDGTYGTLMGIGSSTFNNASTLLRWRGTTVPASFTHGSAGGTDIFFRAQDAFAASGGDGADIVFQPGSGDGAGTAGKFRVHGALTIGTTYDVGFARNSSTQIKAFNADNPTSGLAALWMSGLLVGGGAGYVSITHYGHHVKLSGNYPLQWSNTSYDASASADLSLARDSANIFRFSTSDVTDAVSFLKLSGSGSAPSAYTNAADTDGKHAIFRAQDGGTHSAADPDGGDFRFIVGAAGSGGSGADGQFLIYDSGVTQSFRFLFSGGDASFGLDTGELYIPIDGGDLHIQPANGTAYIYSTGSKTLNLAHNDTDGVISTSSGDLQLNPATGFVGINKSSPGFPLDVASTSTNTARFYTTNDNSNGVSIHIIHDSPSPADNDKVGTFYFLADDDGATQRVIGRIAMNFDDVTSTTMDSSWIVSTMDNVNAGDFNTNATITSLGAFTDASAEAFKEWDGTPGSFFGKSVVAGLRELKCEVYHSSRQSPGKPIRERHLSPSAEDLWRVFPGLGRDPERLKASGQTPGIAAKDLGGLAICGVVEVADDVDALKARVAELEQEVERLKAA